MSKQNPMASDSKMLTFYLFLVVCNVSLAYSSAVFPEGSRVTRDSVKESFRRKRQVCADGTYSHEGRTCCYCGIGQYVVTHCSTEPNDGKCDFCKDGTYSSVPNSQTFCEPCRSCDHPNAYLEVEEICTNAVNTKCRCKKGHFSTTNIETSRVCHPCQECGAKGILVPCTATNDTICKDKIEGGTATKIVVPIIVFLVLIGVALALCWRKKILCFKRQVKSQENGHAAEVELRPLRDIEQHLSEIAGILGWKDMREVAMRSGIPTTTIDNCEQSHPGDKEEQTYMLLRKFLENEGRAATEKLIRILKSKGKKDKVEKVSRLLFDAKAVDSTPVV